MAQALYFYTRLPVRELEAIVEAHQEDFDHFLEETFSEDELQQFERKLDVMGAVWAQPILSELTFDDLDADPAREAEQRFFFEECQSSVLIENLPDLETNPFQVSWLIQLASKFDEVLVDQGELKFKEDFLKELRTYKSVDSFISSTMEKVVGPELGRPVTPIDFLLHDIYKELDRLGETEVLVSIDKTRVLYQLMRKDKLDAHTLLRKSGLNPKDFGDHLEKLKFILKKA